MRARHENESVAKDKTPKKKPTARRYNYEKNTKRKYQLKSMGKWKNEDYKCGWEMRQEAGGARQTATVAAFVLFL